MVYADNFNSFRLNSVWHDIWRSGHNEFARSLDAARPTKMGYGWKLVLDKRDNSRDYATRGFWIVASNEGMNGIEVLKRFR